MIGPSDSFIWGSGGAQLTPSQIDAQRKVAQALMAQGSDYSPVQSWTQGASRVAQAIFGGMQARDANEAAKANMAMEEKLIAPYLPGGTPQTATPSVSTPMGHTSIPSGSIDPRLSSAISTVASAHPDISPEYMTRLALVENGGRVEGGSPLSSAQGPFQFLSGTAKQYGLGNPNDPNQSAEAAARLTLDNKAALTQALGREPTPGELYLAHQQGSGGAINLLSHPNAPVESVIGAAAARNNAAAPGMTAGQFAGKWTGKFGDIVQTVDPAQKNIIDAQADDPAALPVNAQPTQGYAIPGQAQAPAVPMINPATFAKAAPYLSPFTQKFLGGVMMQQMERAQKQADPLYRAQLIEEQAKIDALPLERRGKELANEKAERDLQGEGATPLTPEERASFVVPQGQAAYKTRRGDIKFGPAGTSITNTVGNGEGAFEKKGAELTATRYNDLIEDGQNSRQMASDITTLVDLGKTIGTGKGAQFKASIGPYAESLGIKVDGLSDIQAYEAVINRVAPNMRVKGSGSQSDFELKNFLKALPSLGNTPEGNEIAASVLQGLTQNKILASEIASKALNKEITRADAERQLRELPDPMAQYREYKKGHSAPSVSKPALSAPQPGLVKDGYRFKGGDPSRKENWEQIS